MGRKSRGRNSSSSSNSSLSVRGMMRGLKNRWGRFQCPRDGSICISLEAWHWHRHKYHQTDPGLNYVELDPDDVDDATPLQSTSPPTSSSSHPPHPHHPPPSSPRLLPPEAFAPRRQPEVVSFPDDASDLTEPEIPFLLSEEVTSPEEGLPGLGGGAPSLGLRWESMEEEAEEEEQQSRRQPPVVTMTTTATTSDSRSLLPETVRAVPATAHLHGNDSHGNGSHGNDSRGSDSHGNQEVAKAATRDSRSLRSPSLETEMAHRHGNDLHGNRRQRHYRSRSRSRERSGPGPSHGPTTTGGTTAAGSLSFAMDLVAVHVLRLLRRDGSASSSAEAAEDILRDVESRFSGLGLSGEGLKGVVAGALMGARDQWTNGYNAGWKDGASQVLNSPILLQSSATPAPPSPLHSPPGDLVCARNPGRVTLLTSSGQRSQNDDKEDAMPAEKIVNSSRRSSDNLETGSVEQTRNHGNDLNNNDAFIATDDRPN